ncbi:MAG: diguanylate cyclase [Pseudomonadota bacterium]
MPVGITVYLFLAAAIIVTRSAGQRGSAHWVMLAMAAWIVGGMIELLADTAENMFVGRTIVDISTAALPSLVMMAICYFTAKKCPLWVKFAVWIVPLTTIGLALTHPLHDFLWSAGISEGRVSRLDLGPWFLYAHLPHGLFITAINILLMFDRARSLRGDQRIQTAILIIAFSVPLAISVAHVGGKIGVTVSPAPLFAAALAPLIGWLILRRGVLIEGSLEYRLLVEKMVDAVIVVDQDLRVVSFNPAGAELIGAEPGPTGGLELPDVLPEAVPVLEGRGTGTDVSVDGQRFSIQVSRIERGLNLSHAIVVCRNITNEWTARAALMRSEELLRSLVNNSSNAILRLRRIVKEDGSADYRVLVANPIAATFFNTEPGELIGQDIGEALEWSIVESSGSARHTIAKTLEKAVEGGRTEQIEFSLETTKGVRWYRLSADPVGSDVGVVCFDITRQREQNVRLETEAFQDPLTGVLNRRGFERLASQCLAGQSDDVPGVLLFVDLNDFKQINDELGHETGDWVLRQIGKRLHDVTGDNHILGRIGGDEFVVLATNVDATDAKAMREAVQSALAEPYHLNGDVVNAGASVGMASFPSEGVTLTSLMRHADAAMYADKAAFRSARSKPYRVVK